MQPFVLRGRMSSQHWILSFHLSLRHSTAISWTLNDVREKTWLYLFLLKNPVLLLSDIVLFLWTIGLLWVLKNISPTLFSFFFRSHPPCITIISELFFPPSFHSFATFHQRPQLTLYRATWMSFSGTWLSACLMSLGSASHLYAVWKKRVRLAPDGHAL